MAPRISASSRLIPIEDLTPDNFKEFGEVIQRPATHNGTPALQRVDANQGSATKWIDVTRMNNWYELSSSGKPARVSMNMFVCKPRALTETASQRVFEIKILERHPFTPQTFVPMGLSGEDKRTSYLVVVAPTLPLGPEEQSGRPSPFPNDLRKHSTPSVASVSDGPKPKGPGLPDLDNIKAFIARGDQAVTYGPGTWHAPMVVLGAKPIEFVVVQFANGVGIEDCQEVEIESHTTGQGLAVNVTEASRPGDVSHRSKL